jgi:ABC-type multidrug transport system ATPase subunit
MHAAVDAGCGALVTTHYMDETQQCDRVVVMADGRVVAAGSPSDISAGHRAVRVRTADWPAAFAVLDEAGQAVALVGRDLRVPDGDVVRVQALLDAHHIAAQTSDVPATFEEVFVELTHSVSARRRGVEAVGA